MEQQQIQKFPQEMLDFRDNVDSWIKQIREEFSQLTDLSQVVEENAGNTQHNYELIYELKEQVEQLRAELNTLKIVQLVSLKTKIKQEH